MDAFTCIACKHFAKNNALDLRGGGICTRNPPVPMLLPAGAGQVSLTGMFPPVDPEKTRCGEFLAANWPREA